MSFKKYHLQCFHIFFFFYFLIYNSYHEASESMHATCRTQHLAYVDCFRSLHYTLLQQKDIHTLLNTSTWTLAASQLKHWYLYYIFNIMIEECFSTVNYLLLAITETKCSAKLKRGLCLDQSISYLSLIYSSHFIKSI